MTGRTFGFECELSGGTNDVLATLHAEGHLASPRLHVYHCECGDCDPHNEDYSYHAQADCTADGEIILNVHRYGSERADTAIAALARALRQARATVSTDQGFHVHVGMADLDGPARLRLWRLFLRYQQDMAELASARWDRVRDYNVEVSEASVLGWGVDTARLWTATDDDIAVGNVVLNRGNRGGWLWQTHYETFEFRLWNATTAEWRMRLAIGVSVAMVEAAKAGVNVNLGTPPPLEAVLDPFLSEEAWAGILRQRYSKGGVAA